MPPPVDEVLLPLRVLFVIANVPPLEVKSMAAPRPLVMLVSAMLTV